MGCVVGWYCMKHPNAELKLGRFGPVLDEEIGYVATATHFGISSNDAFDLLDPTAYRKDDKKIPKTVVLKRLREFLKKRRA